MFKQQRFILRVLLCAVGLTSMFGLDKERGIYIPSIVKNFTLS